MMLRSKEFVRYKCNKNVQNVLSVCNLIYFANLHTKSNCGPSIEAKTASLFYKEKRFLR